eukprot:scaffold262825_cov14-Tisochrysis_lutea.AAC.1
MQGEFPLPTKGLLYSSSQEGGVTKQKRTNPCTKHFVLLREEGRATKHVWTPPSGASAHKADYAPPFVEMLSFNAECPNTLEGGASKRCGHICAQSRLP